MRLVVVSHVVVWPSAAAASGYATTGGFPFQVRALAELFDATTLCVPVVDPPGNGSGTPLEGEGLSVLPLRPLPRSFAARRMWFPFWLAGSLPRFVRAVRHADAVHVPIPGDIGTIGIVVAEAMRRPLFVRHCGNWARPRTRAERVWRWYMERATGRRRVMVATGESDRPPSGRNREMTWIFSTTLSDRELEARRRVRPRSTSGTAALVTVGRQVHAKGTATTIEAVRMLVDRGVDATLDVVGDGPDLPRFRELARRLRLTERVRFHGEVGHDDVLRILDANDAFVFPTQASEGFPKAVLEALACGLPVVTSSVSSLPNIVGRAGVVVDETRPQAVADAIARVLDDPAGYERMSEEALAFAAGRSLERWRDALGSLLTQQWGPLQSDRATTAMNRGSPA